MSSEIFFIIISIYVIWHLAKWVDKREKEIENERDGNRTRRNDM